MQKKNKNAIKSNFKFYNLYGFIKRLLLEFAPDNSLFCFTGKQPPQARECVKIHSFLHEVGNIKRFPLEILNM